MVQEQPVTQGKILYVGGFELPDRNAAAHRVLNNAKVFRELGYQTVFCGVDKDIKNAPKTVCGFENNPLSYPKGAKDWFFSLLDISHYLKVLDSNADIKLVMCYNLHALPLMRLIRVCKKRGIKIAADCTEWYENKPSLHPVKMIKCIDTALAMRAQKKLDGMIAISSYLENYYKPFVPVMLRLPPLVDVSDEKWQHPLLQKSGRLKLVYSGSPGDTKDKLGQIVRLLADLCYDFEFKVVGVTKQQFLQTFNNCESYITKLGNKLVFAGRVSHSESVRALYEADYCVFVRDCTRKNTAGFPTKFVECFTSGVGIIASDISDIKNYFPVDSVSVLCADSTDKSIAAALETALCKDVCEIRKNKRNGLENNPFDIKNNLEVIRVFLSDLVI